MPRLFIVDPNLKSLHGHYFGYAARVGRAAEALGVHAVILGSADLDLPAMLPPVVPSFSQAHWHEVQPAQGQDPYLHLGLSARRFAAELASAFQRWDVTADDALFLPYANLAELDGIGLLSDRLGAALPRVSLLFRRDVDEQGLDAGV